MQQECSACFGCKCHLAAPMHKRKGLMVPHITRVICCTAPFHMFTEPETADIIILSWPTVMFEEDKVGI